MTRAEAIKSMVEGKFVTHNMSPKGHYVYFDESVGAFYNAVGDLVDPAFMYEFGWYLFLKEPKVLKCWVNFYEDETARLHYSLEEANRCACDDRIGEAVEVTKIVEDV